VNLVNTSDAELFAQQIADRYHGKTDIRPDVYVCSARDGAGAELKASFWVESRDRSTFPPIKSPEFERRRTRWVGIVYSIGGAGSFRINLSSAASAVMAS